MTTSPELEWKLTEFLLGRLSPEEREEIERRLFTEDGMREELLATADDLIQAYLAGTLPVESRVPFETYFLSLPLHRQRLAFIRSLRSTVKRMSRKSRAREGAARSGFHAFFAVAAVLAAIALALVLLLTSRPMGKGMMHVATSLPPAPRSTPAAQATPEPKERQGLERPQVRVVRLSPEASTPVSVALTSRTASVRFEVTVNEGHPSFDALVLTAQGNEAWRARGLVPRAAGEPLAFTVPASVLASDRYTLVVQGDILRGNKRPPRLLLRYPLRVLRKP